jgi:hypothetical protein
MEYAFATELSVRSFLTAMLRPVTAVIEPELEVNGSRACLYMCRSAESGS